MYIGTDGVYSYTFKHEQRPDCPVCSEESSVLMEVNSEWTVVELIDALAERPDMYVCLIPHSTLSPPCIMVLIWAASRQVKRPSLSATHRDGSSTNIYLQGPPSLEKALRPNLDKMVSEFVGEGETILVTASSLPLSLNVVVKFV